VICCDFDHSLDEIFAEVNKLENAPVRFDCCGLDVLPYEDETFDDITCISVLEHTENYADILKEFYRVLAPGGSLVVTFDICLDGQSEISPEGASALIKQAGELFNSATTTQIIDELKCGDILTTGYIRKTQPGLLPWRRPTVRQSLSHLRHHARWPKIPFQELTCCGMVFQKRQLTAPMA
jgi:SAM-dependent methyltransferase